MKTGKYYLSLFFLYFIANGGILFIPNAIYWDDWVLYRTPPAIIMDTFSQLGSMFNFFGYLHVSLLTIGPWIYKVLTFILMIGSAFLLDSRINRYKSINDETRFFIVLLFLVLPFNIARVVLIDFPYTLCYFLFFLAWTLMSRSRILAIIIFFFSFNTNSLLVFYAIPFIDMLYINKDIDISDKWLGLTQKRIIDIFKKNIDYISLPFVFFSIKVFLFKPYGLYAGYNESYSLKNIIKCPIFQAEDFLITIYQSLSLLTCLTTVLLIAAVYLFFNLLLKSRVTPISRPQDSQLLKLGVVVLIFGLIPYWILGITPSFNEWSSRHQLLMPLGGALFLVGIASFSKKNFLILSSIVGISLSVNLFNFTNLFIDWQKQQQLIQLFSITQEVKNANLIVIDDKTTNFNAIARKIRFYEWNGLLENAFGDESRFGISRLDFVDSESFNNNFKNYFDPHYKAGQFTEENSDNILNIEINRVEENSPDYFVFDSFFPKFIVTIKYF